MRLVIGVFYYVGNVMVLAEKDFAPDIQSGYRFVKMLLLSFLVLLLVFGAETAFAVDWTPCEGPCSDPYTQVYATSPASGSSHPPGTTVRFTTNVERIYNATYQLLGHYIPFTTQVSTSGGSGWSTTIISPASYCIYYPPSTSCTSYPPYAENVDIVIDVTIGTGTTRVTVKLNNTIGSGYISPVFYFDVTGGGVRVTGLTDMSGTWSGSGDAANNDDVCIYSPDGSYDLLAEGPTYSGDYVLENGADKIPVTVYWNNTTGTSGRSTLDSANNPSLSGVTGGHTSNETCSGGSTANISWKALESDLLGVPPGEYTATISTTVSTP